MANPHKGEVEFTVGGRSYKAVFSTNAICELEKELGYSVHLVRDGVLTVRAILWAALRKHHPDLSLIAVGDLIDDMGRTEAADFARRVYEIAFPPVQAVDAQGPLADQSQPAGTGQAS
jgi:hypothetical protein